MSGFWFHWFGDGPRNWHFLKIPLLVLMPSLDWEQQIWSKALILQIRKWRLRAEGWFSQGLQGHSWWWGAEQILVWVWGETPGSLRLQSWSPRAQVKSHNLRPTGHFPYSWLSSWVWPRTSRPPFFCSLNPCSWHSRRELQTFPPRPLVHIWCFLPLAICVALYVLLVLDVPG